MSRIRKSFPPPPFSLWIYFFFFLRVPFLYCYVPFCCYCLPLASARLVEDVTGKSHHHLHQYFVLCFPSLALMTTYLAAVFSALLTKKDLSPHILS